MENKVDNIMLGDKTLKQWEEEMQTPPISSEVSYEEAEQLGFMSPEDRQLPQEESENKFYNTLDAVGIEHPEEGKQYEKLSIGESWADAGKSLLVEASHVLMPKDWEIQYESRTKFGETTKYLWRYGMGTAALMASGGALAGAKVLANAGKLGKAGQAIGKLLSGKDLIKTGATASKAAQIGAKIGNASLGGAISGAIADFNLYRPEENEGHFADIFGETDNAFINFLQTDDNDTDLDAKLKNVVEGFFMGAVIGNALEFAIKPLGKKFFNGLRNLRKGKAGAEQEVVEAYTRLEKTAKTADLVEEVKKIKAEAEANGQDPSQLLIDRLHPDDNIEAQKMLKQLNDGEDIFVHQDGTWDISISKWDDAYKVSEEEYKKQLLARDMAGEGFAGDTAISHQNSAVRETWINRGWLGSEEDLTSTNANKIANNYTDKWQIDNKVKVEFVDGLTINGKAVEGNTSATKYKGKTTKTFQNKIDRKQLQISKLEDRITQLEGGNAPVGDELENLKEELRIAYNELKELTKEAKGKNKIPDITIKIDKNAKNPYATLRAELEHARDIAKGEVPKGADVEGSGTHFSRYTGDNEGEVATGYTYKKSVGKNKALSELSENQDVVLDTTNTNIKHKELEYVLTDMGDSEGGHYYQIKAYDNNNQEVAVFTFTKVNNDLIHIANQDVVENLQRQGIGSDIIELIKTETGISKINGTVTTDAGKGFFQGLEQKGKIQTYKSEDYNTALVQHQNNFKTTEDTSQTFMKDEQIPPTPIEPQQQVAYNIDEVRKAVQDKDPETLKTAVKTKENAEELIEQMIDQRANAAKAIEEMGGKTQAHTRDILKEKDAKNTIKLLNSIKEDLPSAKDFSDENIIKGNAESTEPVQLKIDFTQNLETKQSTEEVVNGLVNGEIKPTTKGDIEALVAKIEQTEPDIAGFNWDDVIKNPEKYLKDLEDLFTDEDASGLIEALNKGDVASLETIIKKELAAARIWGHLYETIKTKGLNLDDDTKIVVIDAIKHLADYIKGVKSGFGTGLEAQKGINELLESYGTSRLSSWTKEGIDVFTQKMVDSLNNIINLNFTRGQKLTPTQMRQQIIAELFEDAEARDFMAFLSQNKDFSQSFIEEIEKIVTIKGQITKEEGAKALQKILNLPEYRAMFEASQLASDKKTWFKVLKDWCDGNGGFTSYYVHNLLSGAGSLVKNVTSGLINTVYFPAKKLLTGLDLFLDNESKQELVKEGWRTYKNMVISFHESLQLMKEAFISGNGKLTDIGENTLNIDGGKFKGFHEWKIYDKEYYLENPSKIWETLQNFHSIMTRAMGATDEFMSQLNYRSIARSKALQEAENAAIPAGKVGDEDWINKKAEEFFQKKFDKHGKPLDVEALNEARTILYQNNLDGTMFDYSKGKPKQMREQTFVMQLGSSLQQQANKHWFVKTIFPFVKTGTNILQMALDHNGLYMALSPSNNRILFSKTEQGALARSQCAFGCFSLALGVLWAMNGRITGSAPSDPRERKALFATGWRPYSIKVGDTYISYQGYEPLHGMLGFAADCANLYSTITNPDDEKRVEHFQAQVLPTLVNNFLDKAAFRTGLKQLDLLLNPQNSEEWAKAIAQVGKGILPNSSLVTNTRSIGKHDVLQPQTIYERMFYRYFPNLWQPKDYRRNVFGEKQSITGLLISSAGSQDGSPEEEALEYLAKYGYSPSEIDDVISNTGLKLTEFKDSETGRSLLDAMKEEMSVVTINGRTLREAVRDLVTSEEYQYLPDGVDLDTGARWGAKEDTKINAVNSIFLMYKQRAKKNIINNNDYFTDSQGRTLQEAREEVKLKRLQQLNNLY